MREISPGMLRAAQFFLANQKRYLDEAATRALFLRIVGGVDDEREAIERAYVI